MTSAPSAASHGARGKVYRHVAAIDAKPLVFLERDFQVQIARRGVSDPGAALPGESQSLAIEDALRYRYVKRARLIGDVPLFIDNGHLQRERALRSVVGVLQAYRHPCMMILARPFGRAGTGSMSRARAEQVAEEIVGVLRARASAELESVADIRARPNFVAIFQPGAEGIECRSLLRVFKYLVSLANILEARFSVRVLVQVGMELACQLAMSGLDFRVRSRSRNAHRGVIVLVFHGLPVSSNH